MNILMIGPNRQSKGGMATVINNFYQYNNKNSIYHLDSWKEKRRFFEGLQAFIRIRKIIKRKKIDIVHFHVAQKGSFYRKSFLASIVPRESKVIFHMHASQFDYFYNQSSSIEKQLIKKILNSLDGIVVLSPEWAEFYQKITNTPLKIIENAVIVPPQNDYSSAGKFIVTFGRLGKRKGTYDLLEVAQRINKSFPDVVFVLFGDGEIEKIQNVIQQKRISNVRIGGWIGKKNQKRIFKKTILHFLPSYNEGLPMAVLETMANGIPNITSNVGGIPQVIQNGKNGFFTAPGDVEGFVSAIETFLGDIKMRNKFSIESQKKVLNDFSQEKYFIKWDNFYEELSEPLHELKKE
ncbi:glycosyltransferase family 4 protein [Enterococcus gilvus]|uniref:glycosyltransferase family 4 protein n=1 Tax=Enterococcus gilvus TaxID=160453 RepID=UPI003D6A5DBF